MWNYIKYLGGKKISVEKLAIKFKVVERTIQKDIFVDGMHYEHCANRVKDWLKKIRGIKISMLMLKVEKLQSFLINLLIIF